MMCFAPVLLAGYLMTLHPNSWHVSSFDGALVEVQTCDRGLGLDLKASTAGIGSLSLQYGLQMAAGNWSFTFTPKAGVGYFDHAVPELSSQVNFSLGAQVLVGYRRARVAFEYWHQSNAYLGDVNAGLDMLAFTGGWQF